MTTTNTTHVGLHRMKRGGGREVWLMRWYGTDGKRYGVTIGDCRDVSKRDALVRVREQQSKMDGGKVRRDKPMPLTLAQFRDRYVELVKGSIAPASLALVRRAFKWATDTLGEGTDVSSMNAVHAAKIRNAMSAAKCEPPSVHQVSAYLRAAFNRGIKFELVHVNPFAGVEKPKGADRAKDATIRTPEEIDKLKREAPDAWWRSLLGLLFTGLRRDEALAMQWDSIDFDGGNVTIRQCDAGSFRVGSVAYPVLAWEAKTSNSYRVVPIAADTMLELRQLQRETDGSPYVFLSLARLATIERMMFAGKWGADSVLVNNLLRDFQALQRRLLGKGVKVCTLHDCRKSFCTHASAIVPIQSLAAMAGDTPAVLMRYYTRPRDVDADAIRKATNSAPALKLAG